MAEENKAQAKGREEEPIELMLPVDDEQQTTDTAQKKLQDTASEVRQAFEQLKERASEDDDAPVGSLTLRKVLGGDILSARLVRSQVWLFMLIALFITIYVAMRYQCQQDVLDISRLEKELTDAKYKALASKSSLTEKSRESHIARALKANNDSLLKPSEQPPFIVNVPEE